MDCGSASLSQWISLVVDGRLMLPSGTARALSSHGDLAGRRLLPAALCLRAWLNSLTALSLCSWIISIDLPNMSVSHPHTYDVDGCWVVSRLTIARYGMGPPFRIAAL